MVWNQSMYLEYFGLDKSPFKITPDPELFYSGGKRGDILEALVYSILSGSGITKVVGEVGSGKTMLCRMLENKLPPSVEIIYIANPSLSAENILQVIAFELELVLATTSKLEAMQQLQKWLLKQHAAGKQVVVFIEEAQCMPIETLEEIRLLSNLETNQDKLLQIVLFGQPELDVNLARVEIRQLKDRISNCFELSEFKVAEIKDYLDHRLRLAGYRGPSIFTPRAVKLIYKYSKGLVRRVNILADKVMLAAYADGEHIIKANHVHLAGIDSQFKDRKKISTVMVALYVTVIVGLLSSVATYSYIKFDSLKYPAAQINLTKIEKKKIVQEIISVEEATKQVQSEKKIENPLILAIDKNIIVVQQVNQGLKSNAIQSLDDYLKLTKQWLLTRDPKYTIQILYADQGFEGYFVEYLNELKQLIDTNNVYIYHSQDKNKTTYGVLFGAYETKEEATMMKKSLPKIIKRKNPFIRTVNSLKRKAHR